MKSLFRPDWDKILLIFALFIAIGFFILNTKNNLGFTPDSVTYYEVAKNIVNGKGIVDFRGNPVHHWPPGYSAFLAITSALFSTNPLQAGNILTSILLFLTLILLYKIFKKFGIAASIVFTLCGLYSISPIATTYILYLSEGPFILFSLLGILFLLEWLKQKNMMLLGLAALAIGVSFWIRYAGLYFIAGITLYLFF